MKVQIRNDDDEVIDEVPLEEGGFVFVNDDDGSSYSNDPPDEPLVMKMTHEWCDCEYHYEDHDEFHRQGPLFMEDDQCHCGVNKHHYHCRNCGGVTQVG